jgi:hypothetical protein
MPKLPELPEYEFTVTTVGPDGEKTDQVVEASYFQEAGQFTVLKDAGHVAVDAFKTTSVLRVRRSVDPVDFA